MAVFNGGNGNDTLIGGEDKDVLIGRGGNDRLEGGGEKDLLLGGDGNDTLIGDKGDDIKLAGYGDDRLIWNNGDGSDTMRGQQGYDVTEVNGALDEGDQFELRANGKIAEFERNNLGPFTLNVDDVEKFEINGHGGDDELTVKDLSGTDVQTVIFSGGDGNDTLDASATNVPVEAFGGEGNDTLIGGAADDLLSGDGGNDILIGNGGNDVLIGGDGDDVLIGSVSSSASAGSIVEFWGKGGSDTYQLAEAGQLYYGDGAYSPGGTADYAMLKDFDAATDTIQLEGDASKYVLGQTSAGHTGIYFDSNQDGVYGSGDDLIAAVETASADFNLSANYVSYV